MEFKRKKIEKSLLAYYFFYVIYPPQSILFVFEDKIQIYDLYTLKEVKSLPLKLGLSNVAAISQDLFIYALGVENNLPYYLDFLTRKNSYSMEIRIRDH